MSATGELTIARIRFQLMSRACVLLLPTSSSMLLSLLRATMRLLRVTNVSIDRLWFRGFGWSFEFHFVDLPNPPQVSLSLTNSRPPPPPPSPCIHSQQPMRQLLSNQLRHLFPSLDFQQLEWSSLSYCVWVDLNIHSKVFLLQPMSSVAAQNSSSIVTFSPRFRSRHFLLLFRSP